MMSNNSEQPVSSTNKSFLLKALGVTIAAGAAMYLAFGGTPVSEKITPMEHLTSQVSVMNNFAKYHDAESDTFKNLVDNQANHFNKKLPEDFKFSAEKVEGGLEFGVDIKKPEEYACNPKLWWFLKLVGMASSAEHTAKSEFQVKLLNGTTETIDLTAKLTAENRQKASGVIESMCVQQKNAVEKMTLTTVFNQEHKK